ncbi:MAG TPA: peptidase T [Kouleothrix sp.]|uniref:peptidase T n=1 Tax=Kouleothrix sp. TaxID=2779161 RepID=UPI002D173D97|nr:peptidase T [Kouleothrix sp.]HRC75687.1 peptidase T [Kouleothrix sp.]
MITDISALEARFLRYVQIDTQSDEESASVPSTAKQYDLLRLLERELRDMGVADARITTQGFVIGSIPATAAGAVPRVAFLAHVDTAPAYSGTGVKPIVHRAYAGGPIALPDDPAQVLRPEDNPYLAQKLGDDIVTASGTTLLGADDKAGVAIIMALAEHLLAHPEIPHGEVRVCFTVDEEIGTGINSLDLADLDVDYAYTLDGAELGELVYETFSADKAVVAVTGVSIHPGSAFGKLVNALNLAAKIVDALPQHTRTPETTRDREGFVHLYQMRGTAAQAELSFILRDFDRDGLERHGELLRAVCAAVQAGEPRASISCTITPQYRNMRYWLEDDMRPVEVATRAMRSLGVEPFSPPIRGGTDGSKLTERGLLTPNIFTGMQNIHGPLEWVSLQDMAKSVEVCVAIARGWAVG